MGMVEYRTIHGQDPVVVAAALTEAGFRVVPEESPETDVLTIQWSDDNEHDRAEARSVISGVRTTTIDGPANVDPEPVRFIDES